MKAGRGSGEALAPVLFAVVVGMVACTSSGRSPSGRVEVRWEGGADTARVTGEIVAPARATWCTVARRLELVAEHGDTGFGLVVYPADSAPTGLTGDFPLFPPHLAPGRRPATALALRLLGRTVVDGFRSESGSVALTRSDNGRLSGTFSGITRHASDTLQLALTVTGRLERVPVTTDAPECGR